MPKAQKHPENRPAHPPANIPGLSGTMYHQEKRQWNEKWQAQLDKAIQELVEKAQELDRLEAEIEAIRAFIELIASQIRPEPPE